MSNIFNLRIKKNRSIKDGQYVSILLNIEVSIYNYNIHIIIFYKKKMCFFLVRTNLSGALNYTLCFIKNPI